MKNVLQRVLCLLTLLTLVSTAAWAGAFGEAFIIMRQGTGYSGDTWFYTGGDELNTTKIKEIWDAGKRITNATYNGCGWFVSGAANTGISGQTYHYNNDWPTTWLNENFNKGYYITSIGHANRKWLIVMSQGTGYDGQVYFLRDQNTVGTEINRYWNMGYRITQTCLYNGKWLVIMSHNSPYGMQTYAFRDAGRDAVSFIGEKWNENYRITNWVCDGNYTKYLVVMSTFSNGSVPVECYIDNCTPGDQISAQWKEGYAIAYVGGGDVSRTYDQCPTCLGACTQVCAACRGYGQVAYLGPCRYCSATGRVNCMACAGQGGHYTQLLPAAPVERHYYANQQRPDNVVRQQPMNSQQPGSNFSSGGVPNVNVSFSNYVIDDNWQIDAEGQKVYWSGESSVYVDVAGLSVTVNVAGRSYNFPIYAIGSGDKFGKTVRLYLSQDLDDDEYIALLCWDSSELRDMDYAFIQSPSRGIKITLNSMKNKETFMNFHEKCAKYLENHHR